MFLVPIGHEHLGARRWPLVTLAIAVICAVVQLRSCMVEAQIAEPLQLITDDMNELLSGVAAACRNDGSCIGMGIYEIADALEAGTIGHQLEQEQMRGLREQARTLLRRYPPQAFGYRPSSSGFLEILTAMFIHGGFWHFFGNMLFLYLVGISIEERWGHWRFALLYLCGGIVATLAYALLHARSETPLIGASGAIAAGMGAFAVLYLRTRIKFFYWIWIRFGTFSAPAWLVLPLWFFEQLLAASNEADGGGVAYSAHAGGFLFGAVVAGGLRLFGYDKKFTEQTDIAAGGWSEDEAFLAAETLAAKGDRRAAGTKIDDLLSRKPDHRGGQELGLQLALDGHNFSRAVRFALLLFPQWAKLESGKIRSTFKTIVAMSGDQVLDERVLSHTATAAHLLRDRDLLQDILRRLYRSHPKSGTIPRCLWLLAEIYEHTGDVELGNRFLQKLIADYPGDQWADRAQTKLRGFTG